MYGLPPSAIEKINAVFKENNNIEKVILYGSRSKGNYKNGSDIDLTILGNVSFNDLLRLDTRLDDLLLPWMIDLSIFSQIKNPALIDHINRVGKIFFAKK
jgi:predicted nucleotidyltransferase